MLNTVMTYLTLIAPAVLTVGVILGLIKYSKAGNKEKLILVYLTLALVLEITSRYWFITSNHNLFILSISTFVEFVFFSILYQKFFFLEPKKWINYGLLAFSFYLIYTLISLSFHIPMINGEPSDFNEFNLYHRLLADSVILLLSFLYIKETLTSESIIPLREYTTNTIIILYLIVDMFMSLTIKFMVNENVSLVFFFWALRLVFLLLLYVNLILTVWQNGRQQKLKQFG
ncbi:hypothetical protein KFE94_17800 [bacterium SCSIO 12643]|nr:hypothetical protein KFE94_17800 [bacterium SCSIO 12643]